MNLQEATDIVRKYENKPLWKQPPYLVRMYPTESNIEIRWLSYDGHRLIDKSITVTDSSHSSTENQ